MTDGDDGTSWHVSDGESIMSSERSPEGQAQSQRHRCVVYFAIEGDLRFISHHDTLRLFRRALARADLPVKYSQGFNPQPRIMIPLPRPLGIASKADCIVIEFAEPMDTESLWHRLADQAPQGLVISSSRNLEPNEKLVPDLVCYTLDIGDTPVAKLEASAFEILKAERLEVERKTPKDRTAKVVDIRPYIVDLTVKPDGVCFTLRVTGSGTAKPAEIAALLGFDSSAINHKIERQEIKWQQRP